nr:MAG: major capsid protein [Microvirus sp.]
MKGKNLNIFQRTALSSPKTSTFDLSHDVKLSFDMGRLVPTSCIDVLPGDKFNISVENMLRFAPLISPVMHKMTVSTHYFFVPNRIIWPEWEEWITGDSDVAPPAFDLNLVEPGTIADFLGFNNESGDSIECSPLALAAYMLIYDEYYRDQNLQDSIFVPVEPGNFNPLYSFFAQGATARRAWQHDYFTSCLPFAQKGDEVLIPLGQFTDVDVELKPGTLQHQTWVQRNTAQNPVPNESLADWDTNTFAGTMSSGPNSINLDPNQSLHAKTSELEQEANSITTLRRAFRLQEWLERNARGGTRYIENILAHFGVRSKDARLSRPEYIGGSKQAMTISEVLSTAQTEVTGGENPVGQMAGHGISVGGGNNFSYTASEHGFIIGIISVTPDTAYQQGLPRMHTRTDRLDYAWPTFAHIGEQAVLGQEVYTGADADAAYLKSTFGYIPRYSEYRYMPSRVHGLMKTDLSFWQLARVFDNAPLLNSAFIECDPSRRIFAVTDPSEDTIYAHIYNNIRATRKLPKFGTPHL